jgi:hypothetical protein
LCCSGPCISIELIIGFLIVIGIAAIVAIYLLITLAAWTIKKLAPRFRKLL